MIKRLFFNYTLLAVVLICGIKSASAQGILVDARLQDYTIKLGDQTKLFLVVTQAAKAHVDFPKLGDTITSTVQIVSANKPDTVVDQKNKNMITITQAYIITSFDAGVHTMPAFNFITHGSIVKSNELTIQVQSVKIDTTKSIYDIKKPVIVTYTIVDWVHDHLVWIIGGLILIALIVGLIYYLRNKPKIEPVIKITKPVIPPHTIAIEKLKELQAKKLWQQDEVKLYYIELTDILREYLEQRYDVRTHEQTTDEILYSLKSCEIAADNRAELQRILTTADLVKFAKEKPTPVDNEAAIEKALAFVQKTQQTTQPKETEGGADGAV
ncbi:hypothetical protein [Mucilaginibacter sp. dw_454]|uniref:hypothetical protein n=1 Tax=Mucilaginibacter sp. dw_454 TaxID=2720079 RepID=UPI001BD5716E|nr:hypothetical protein [Mucilaginibacter sp. dw_454]